MPETVDELEDYLKRMRPLLAMNDQPELLERLLLSPANRWKARLLRFSYPELPCQRMALARAAHTRPGSALSPPPRRW